MTKTYLISDTHFGHAKIITFKRDDGTPLRDFESIEQHDEYLIDQWNSVVKDGDKVYHLGDFGFNKKTNAFDLLLNRLNGRKVLIKGNHDCFKLSHYSPHFKDIRGSHNLGGFILTHIPIHPYSLHRWKGNIHGHLHANVIDDPRYINVSAEQLNYKPIDFEEILSNHHG